MTKQTEQEVSHCYSTWSRSYYDEYLGKSASYPPVHRDLIKEVLRRAQLKNLLDAGCGPASLLRDFQDLGFERYGFDLTPEMITEAKRVLGEQGVAAERLWVGSVTDAAAFSPPREKVQFDGAICIGVLPHIPEGSDEAVFDNLRNAVRPGGLVIAQSRNQLFSLFTLNRYSYRFFLDSLIDSGRLSAVAKSQGVELAPIFEDLKRYFEVSQPPIRQGHADEPGYDEVLSRSHNPLILAEQFRAAGFERVQTLYYHFHCLPPIFESRAPELFREASIRREDPNDWRGLFMASAFLLVGYRA